MEGSAAGKGVSGQRRGEHSGVGQRDGGIGHRGGWASAIGRGGASMAGEGVVPGSRTQPANAPNPATAVTGSGDGGRPQRGWRMGDICGLLGRGGGD